MVLLTGVPAPCPASVSILIKTGAVPVIIGSINFFMRLFFIKIHKKTGPNIGIGGLFVF